MWLCWYVNVVMLWCVDVVVVCWYVDVVMWLCWYVNVVMLWCGDVVVCWYVGEVMWWCCNMLMCWCGTCMLAECLHYWWGDQLERSLYTTELRWTASTSLWRTEVQTPTLTLTLLSHHKTKVRGETRGPSIIMRLMRLREVSSHIGSDSDWDRYNLISTEQN